MPPNRNTRAMRALAEELARAGVTDACISPGSRSTALVLAVARSAGIRPWVIVDERSAAFFALGLACETRRPVALLCTSGTAAANYLPAVVEASLSRVPLIVLTADRPPELRDVGAAQTIDQVRLYGSHVHWSVDAATPADVDLDAYFRTLGCRAAAIARESAGPVHVNLPMREPLVDVREELDADATSTDDGADTPPRARTIVHAADTVPPATVLRALAAELGDCDRGLIVCGPGTVADGGAEEITRLAARRGWPILADPLSGLRFGGHDRTHIVDAYDVLLRDGDFCRTHAPAVVVQLGMPAVSAALGRFLATARGRHLLVAPPATWPDPLHRATDIVRAAPGACCAALADRIADATAASPWLAAWTNASRRARIALDRQLADEGLTFEGAILARLHALLPSGTALHVGNSLPVRALDTFVGGSPTALDVYCNRGANGIDGVTSTALGTAAGRDAPTVLVVGDVSFLHDLGALQIAARHRLSLLVVVVNNDGGGIFSFLPQAALGDTFETFFATPHGLGLAGAVTMCGGRHRVVRAPSELAAAVTDWRQNPGLHVVEVRLERAHALAVHTRLLDAALTTVRHAPATVLA
ncbi:MAG: 2-succinyl-5-enolpyruvyl-6-hydroxy-3-cyclohexene-1-carboxylic-acid synthase [Deltaproteobacteria bacterium]|nr:2-succinyl-5-enolpyruvyl-6-hydroxy-3-cyclohexene-1-carboxylic-acid synthase [Deltaproteobacteria bacterium]